MRPYLGVGAPSKAKQSKAEQSKAKQSILSILPPRHPLQASFQITGAEGAERSEAPEAPRYPLKASSQIPGVEGAEQSEAPEAPRYPFKSFLSNTRRRGGRAKRGP